MQSNPTGAIAALRAISAMAEKLANDIAAGRLWAGDAQTELRSMQRHLDNAVSEANR